MIKITESQKVDLKPFGLSYNNEPTLITVDDHEIYKDIHKRNYIYWDLPKDYNDEPRLKESTEWVNTNKDKIIMMIKLPFLEHKYYINPIICEYDGVDCIKLELL